MRFGFDGGNFESVAGKAAAALLPVGFASRHRCPYMFPPSRTPRKMGFEGIVSKHKGSAYRSGRSPDWLKMKNPACAAVKREEEEDWGKGR
jgi:hypothetical protein